MSYPEMPPNTWALLAGRSDENTIAELVRAGIPAAPSTSSLASGTTISGATFPYSQLGEALRALGIDESRVMVQDTLDPNIMAIRVRRVVEASTREGEPTSSFVSWDPEPVESTDSPRPVAESEPLPMPPSLEELDALMLDALTADVRPPDVSPDLWNMGTQIGNTIAASSLLVGAISPNGTNVNLPLTDGVLGIPMEIAGLEVFTYGGRGTGARDCTDQANRALENFAVTIGRTVRIWNKHTAGVPSNIRALALRGHSKVLPIFFWSTPVEFTRRGSKTDSDVITSCFGTPVVTSQRDNVGVTVEDDEVIPIVDPSTGLTMAEVRRGVLYIRFDLPHAQSFETVTILENLLSKAAEILVGERRAWMGQSAEDALAGVLVSTKEMRIRECNRSIDEHEQSMVRLNSSLFSTLRNIQNLRAELRAWEMSSEDNAERARKEVERIRALADVAQVRAVSHGLVITTRHINFLHRRKWRLGHQYRIRLHLGGRCGSSGPVVITSNDALPLVRAEIHPHINSAGVPCWGNIGAGINSYLGKYEIAAALDLIIRYLKAANTSDWYVDPYLWPEATGEYALETIPGTGATASSAPDPEDDEDDEDDDE